MPEFTYIYATESLAPADFDRIAVEEAGVLFFNTSSFGCPRGMDIIPQAPEWGTLVIGTGGMGNQGTIVLRGLTRRTRTLLRQGKVALLLRHGVPKEVARVAVGMQWGMEVAHQATSAIPAVIARGAFQGTSHVGFGTWIGEGEVYDLTFPRKEAAAAIAAEVVKRRGVKIPVSAIPPARPWEKSYFNFSRTPAEEAEYQAHAAAVKAAAEEIWGEASESAL